MNDGTITLGIRIDADGSAAVTEVKTTTGEIDRLGKATRTASSEAERLNQSSQNLAQGFRTATIAGAGLIGLNLGAGLARDIVQAADAMTNLESRLRLVSNGYIQLQTAKQYVIDIAQSTRQAIDATGDLYFKIAKGGETLDLSQQQVVSLTATVSRAVALSGATAESAKASIMQFGQALASGTLRGDELNSVMEQTPALAEAIAKGMGKSVGELRAMGEAGQLTVQQIVSALNNQAPQIEAQFNKLTPTVGGAFQQLSNSGLVFVGRLDQATGASHLLAGTIKLVADNIDGVAVASVSLLSVGLASLVGRKMEAALAARALAAQEVALASSTTSLNAALGMKTAQVGSASIAMRAAGGVVTALGGPIGILISVLSLGATAWAVFGSSAASAAEKAAAAGRSIAEEAVKTGKAELEIARAKRDMAADKYFDSNMRPGALRDEYMQLDSLVTQLETREKNIAARMKSASFGEKWSEALLSQTEKKKKALSELDALYASETQKFAGNQEKQLLLAQQYQEKHAQLETQFDKQGQASSKAQENAYDAAIKKSNDFLAQLRKEVAEEGQTYQQKKAYEAEVIASTMKVAGVKEELIVAYLNSAAAMAQENQATKDTIANAKAAEAANAKVFASYTNNIGALEKSIAEQRRHNDEIGLSTEQLYLLEEARFSDTIATKERALAIAEATGDDASYIEILKWEIEDLRTLQKLKKEGGQKSVAAEQIKKATEEASKMEAEINRSVTDGLMRGFEKGADIASNFIDTLKNMFKTLVLRPLISYVVSPVSGAMSAGASALGMPGMTSGGMGGFGGMLQTGQQASGALNWFNGTNDIGAGIMGSSAGQALGLTTPFIDSAAGFAPEITGLSTLTSTGSALSGVIGVVGAAMPWIAAAYAIYSLVSQPAGGPKIEGNAYGLAGSSGALDVVHRADYAAPYGDGDWGRPGADAARVETVLSPAVRGISEMARRLGGSTAGVGFSLGYNSDPQGDAPDNVSSGVRGADGKWIYQHTSEVERGKGAEALPGEVAKMTLATLASLNLGAVWNPLLASLGDVSKMTDAEISGTLASINSLGELTATNVERVFNESFDVNKISALSDSGENLIQTFQRVTGEFRTTNSVATMLGKDSAGAFGAVGIASEGARKALIDAAGGMDALTQKSANYYQLYYSDSERQAASLKVSQIGVADAFSTLNLAIPDTEAGFRALVESQDLSTASGRNTYLALIDVATAFKAVSTAGWGAVQATKAMAANPSSAVAANDSYRATYDNAVAHHWTMAEASANTGFSESQITSYLADNNLPSFDVGSPLVPRDMVAQIHRDEGIVDAPSWSILRKYGIPVTVSGGGSIDELLAEMKQLRSDLNAVLANISAASSKTAKTLDAAANGGQPLGIVAA